MGYRSFQRIEEGFRRIKDVWDEPAPDYNWMGRRMKTIDEYRVDDILAKTAEMCDWQSLAMPRPLSGVTAAGSRPSGTKKRRGQARI